MIEYDFRNYKCSCTNLDCSGCSKYCANRKPKENLFLISEEAKQLIDAACMRKEVIKIQFEGKTYVVK